MNAYEKMMEGISSQRKKSMEGQLSIFDMALNTRMAKRMRSISYIRKMKIFIRYSRIFAEDTSVNGKGNAGLYISDIL